MDPQDPADEYDTIVVESIVTKRKGDVLNQYAILKTDAYPSILQKSLVPRISGASNYRKAPGVPIYGTAQPTSYGINAVVQLIVANETSKTVHWCNLREEPVIYINGTPYVLRSLDEPLKNVHQFRGITPQRLEQMEERLKADILKESQKYRGLLLVHSEVEEGHLVPCWEYVQTVMTTRDLFQFLQQQINPTGCKIEYYRIPLNPEEGPHDESFDLFIGLFKKMNSGDALVFNCQSGRGRTTFAMVLGLLFVKFQRKILLQNAEEKKIREDEIYTPRLRRSEKVEEALLRTKQRKGEFKVILKLIRVLEHGYTSKSEVDSAIDNCAHIQNIRDIIFSLKLTSQENSEDLENAIYFLERYFYLITFNEFLIEQKDLHFAENFSEWVSSRKEIASVKSAIRSVPKKSLFFPLDSEIEGAETEMRDHVVDRKGSVLSSRSILKLDRLPPTGPAAIAEPTESIAPNYRKLKGLPIHGVAQPTIDEMRALLLNIGSGPAIPANLRSSFSTPRKVTYWVNLRVEPLEYINGRPFVLRSEEDYKTPLSDYMGIEVTRLEQMELRLKEDVITESLDNSHKVMIHVEVYNTDSTGNALESERVVTSWEAISGTDAIKTPRQIYDTLASEGYKMQYIRLPVVISPKFHSPREYFDQFIKVVLESGILPRGNVVDNEDIDEEYCNRNELLFNSGVGYGRTTLAMVIAVLLFNGFTNFHKMKNHHLTHSPVEGSKSFKVIHNLLRVLPHGLSSKDQVDKAIDRCSQFENLRDSILEYKIKAMNCHVFEIKQDYIEKAIYYLEQYFSLIAFAEYIQEMLSVFDENSLDFKFYMSFKQWADQRQEIWTLYDDLKSEDPLNKVLADDFTNVLVSSPSQESIGTPHRLMIDLSHKPPSKTTNMIVNARGGSVFSRGTILKSDHFPGCHKKELPYRTGAPNFRQVKGNIPIYGLGNPTVEGITSVLSTIDPVKNRNIIWISLREEPVIFVNGSPFVLREAAHPFRNMVYTGISGSRVNSMEERLKQEIEKESTKYEKHVLLHGEEGSGNVERAHELELVNYWEEVTERTVKTPNEVYIDLAKQGCHISFYRIPVTDEKAFEVEDFDELVQVLRKAYFDETTDIPAFVFNCQMGQGRTTTGMVAACLIWRLKDNQWLGQMPEPEKEPARIDLMSNFETKEAALDYNKMRYLRGEYRVILDVTRVVSNGSEIKRQVDEAINFCSAVINLRESIYQYYKKGETQPEYHKKAIDFLERYFYLIVFNVYLNDQVNIQELSDRFQESFHSWLKVRPEITNLIEQAKHIQLA